MWRCPRLGHHCRRSARCHPASRIERAGLGNAGDVVEGLSQAAVGNDAGQPVDKQRSPERLDTLEVDAKFEGPLARKNHVGKAAGRQRIEVHLRRNTQGPRIAVDRTGQGEGDIPSAAGRLENDRHVAGSRTSTDGHELESTRNAIRPRDRHRLPGDDPRASRCDLQDSLQRTGLEPEILDASGGAIQVAVDHRARDADALGIQIANHIGLADLRLELHQQLVLALGPATEPAAGQGRIVLVVAGRRHADVINAIGKLRRQQRITAEVIVVATTGTVPPPDKRIGEKLLSDEPLMSALRCL